MVALPLFKLASLFVRHVSKYGAVRLPPISPRPTYPADNPISGCRTTSNTARMITPDSESSRRAMAR